MKKTDLQERISEISAQAKAENRDAFGEAQMIFDEMAGEAQRQAEAAEKAARKQSPLVKTLRILTILAALTAAPTFFYGIYNFPDAPLKQTAEGYTNKQGKPRTKEDFEKFKLWEKAFIISFISVFVFGFGYGIANARPEKREVVK